MANLSLADTNIEVCLSLLACKNASKAIVKLMPICLALFISLNPEVSFIKSN